MRSILLSILGAVIGLRASGVFASVICDTKHDPGINSTNASIPSAGFFAEVTKHCIKNVCATRGKEDLIREQCGPFVLTITRLSVPLSNVGHCIGQFRSIVDQCITTKGVHGGISQTYEALYDISTANKSEGQEEDWLDTKELDGQSAEDDWSEKDDGLWSDKNDFLEERALEEVEDDKEEYEHSTLEARRGDHNGGRTRTRGTGLRPRPKTTRKTKPKSTPKTTPKTTPNTKPKTTLKAKPQTQPEKCPPPADKDGKNGQNAKGKKTIRDVVEEFLPQVLRRKLILRVIVPRCLGGEPDVTRWYKKTILLPGREGSRQGGRQGNRKEDRTTWWRFNSKAGWSKGLQKQEKARKKQSKARPVLRAMNANGQLDVIKMTNSPLSVVGIPTGGSRPHAFARQAGNYLLCNGGFFVRDGQNAYSSVGQTSSTPNFVNIPAAYNQYYERLRGEDDTYLWSGPSLKTLLNLRAPEFKYRDEQDQTATSLVAGSLAHASQSNERLVIVTLPNGDKYLFAYTARGRRDGIDVNQMRTLIETFLRNFYRVTLAQTSQILNLDGGGSIYVSWNRGGTEEVIAAGRIGDETPGQVRKPRRVTNLLKISAR